MLEILSTSSMHVGWHNYNFVNNTNYKGAQSAKYKHAVLHTIISAFCPQTRTINIIPCWLGTWQREQQECISKPATQVRNDFRSFIRQRLIWSRSKKIDWAKEDWLMHLKYADNTYCVCVNFQIARIAQKHPETSNFCTSRITHFSSTHIVGVIFGTILLSHFMFIVWQSIPAELPTEWRKIEEFN